MVAISVDGSSEGNLQFGSQQNSQQNSLHFSQNSIRSPPSQRSQILSQGTNSILGSQRSQARSQPSSYRRHDIVADQNVLRQINLSANFSEALSENGDVLFPRSHGSQPSQNDDLQSVQSSQVTTVDSQLVIWGTDVSLTVCKQKFKEFLKWSNFDVNTLDADELEGIQEEIPMQEEGGASQNGHKKAIYLQKLEDIYTLSGAYPFLEVNCAHINQFDSNLYRQLVCYPAEVIPAFDMAVNELFFHLYPGATMNEAINVRPYNVMIQDSIRSLNPEDINQLKTISGMVIRCSNIIPEMKIAHFECSICHNTTTVEVERGRIPEPANCTQCNTKYSFQLIHNLCEFIDKQQIKLQESPDEMPAGQTPYTVLLYACADLVDAVQPGDRVTVTGIYRASAIRTNPRMRTVKSIYRSHIDAVHFRKHDKNRLHSDEVRFKFSQERIDYLKQLSLLPDIYERLAHSLAPSIYEHEDIKKGILLQLFGGTTKVDTTNTSVQQKHFRSEINILLCGDPGTSKSQLLQYVYKLTPRGQYTSGKGSSAVGLTAYVTRDPDSNQLVLQTGALVLADGGVCCIDEFDKMSDSTRSVLHEVMEQQTLSIAKAGIVCQLNARTSILAAANPVESQWNKNKTIIENIQLPHTLMSRFDLIFLLLDPQDEVYDKRLARHLVSLYYQSNEGPEGERFEMNVLRDYISYARQNIHPRLSREASTALTEAYVDMRRLGIGKGMVSAYPRQLEALIRLAEARAKVRLSNTVTIDDVQEAIRLHKEAIKQSATDPVSGRIDVSILTTGMSSSIRKRRAAIANVLKNLLLSKAGGAKTSAEQHAQFSSVLIHQELKENSDVMITREMFEDALKDLQDEGFLVLLAGKLIRLCSES